MVVGYLSVSHFTEGVSKVHWFGIEGDYRTLVIELLGKTLEDLFQYCNNKFTLKTVCMLAE
jgi:hypothetical protein